MHTMCQATCAKTKGNLRRHVNGIYGRNEHRMGLVSSGCLKANTDSAKEHVLEESSLLDQQWKRHCYQELSFF